MAQAAQRLAIELDSASIEQLTALAQARGCGLVQLLGEAVARYLAQEGQREALLQETIAAWRDAGAGSRLSPQQADAWLSELEAGTLDAEPVKPA